ncbi:pilus assembly protein [Halomonas sp. HNIBRBA4712]|uniref:pilus assembly protein n=1 Tax=Halomonas sp. HNIBRBA4712 TaxID=3373087 RepID=UPI003746369F
MSKNKGLRLFYTLVLVCWTGFDATDALALGTSPPPTSPTPGPTQPTVPDPQPEPPPPPDTPIGGGTDDGRDQYEIPTDRTGLANAPLNAVSQVPPNILLILDNSESGQEGLDGRVAIGNNSGDRETLAACQLTTFNASQCPAGARSPLSKSSIMKKVGRELIDRYRGDINLGLMAYEQNPASRNRDDAFTNRTVVWRLTERALDARYSSDANPSWYVPSFTGAWNATTKRYRARLPGSNYYVFFNAGVPGYTFDESYTTGVPTRDVTEYWRNIQNPTATTDQRVERYRRVAGSNTGWPMIETNRVWYDDPVIAGNTGLPFFRPIVGEYTLPLVDSLRQRGIPNWGAHTASLALNQLEWRTASSPGLGYLHVPIGGLNANGSIDDAHWNQILAKLQPQRHDWNGSGNPMTDPAWPLLATGLTPIEGTMYTVRDYFLNNTRAGNSFGTAQGRSSGISIPNMSNQSAQQCLINANIWLTDGLPSVDRTGRSLGNNVSQALTDAQNAIRRLYNDTASSLRNPVRTYVVGFNLPPDINNLPGVPADPLGELAKAGGTERAYFANDEASLNQVMRQVLGQIIASSQSSTASAVSSDTFDLQGNNLLYSAGFRSGDWSGRLVASTIDASGQRTPRWNAETELARQVGTRRLLTSHQPQGQTRKTGALLSTVTSGFTQAEINWLQGSNQTGLRTRQSPLGDIINASPVMLPGSDTRPPLLLVAANDGMLHGFHADTGRELFAYLPSELTQGASPPLRELTRPGYSHRYFMDGTPAAREITRSDGSKRAIAVGTMGAGGRTVFALDVSNPTSMGAQSVLWEFRRPELGSGVSEPTITQLSDGTWAAIFGNGYNSASYKAALYVVNLQTGALIARLDTGEGSVDAPNGLATPTVTAWPTFNQGARFAYAGDLNGTLWRFPLTQSGGQITKLYTGARSQPITSAPAVTLSGGANNQLMVIFGTGSYFRNSDLADNNVQQLIGIRDQVSRTTPVTSSQLLEQRISGTGSQGGLTVRATTNAALTSQPGWRLALPAGERVVASPSFSSGLPRRVRFSTMRPDTTNPCAGKRVGYFLSLLADTGGSGGGTIFDFNRDGTIDSETKINGDAIVGLQIGSGERLVGVKSADGRETLFTGNPDGTSDTSPIVELIETPLGRRSWRQVNY